MIGIIFGRISNGFNSCRKDALRYLAPQADNVSTAFMKILRELNLRKRKMLVGLLPWTALGVALLTTFIMWKMTAQTVYKEQRAKFQTECSEIQFRIQERMNRYINALYGVQGLFAASQEVDRNEWHAFIRTQDMKGRYPGVAAMEFVERVTEEEKEAFVEGVRKDTSMTPSGYPGFTIHPLSPRTESFVVKYVEPMEGNEKALGVDFGSEPVRMEVLERARDNSEPLITGLMQFSRIYGNPEGFLIGIPIYRNGAPHGTVQERRTALEGYGVSVIRIQDLFQDLFPPAAVPKIDFEIFDGDKLTAENILYDSSPAARLEFKNAKLQMILNVKAGGRSWSILFSASPGFGQAWTEAHVASFVLAAGILLSFLLFGILYSLGTSQTRALDLAHKMTGELRSEIEGRKVIEAHREELYRAVESANLDLADFAYVVSHDLKAPLRGIHSLAAWIVEDKKTELDEDGRNKLGLLIERVERMTMLIEGILEYSRLGKVREELTVVDLNEVVRGVVDIVAVPAHIQVEMENKLPVLTCEKTRVHQLFQNLIANAVKFMDKPSGLIQIGCSEAGAFWKFWVRDNGPGIESKYFEIIFKMFQTVPNYYNLEGTGIGLAIAKRIVEMYGGKMWVESEPGKGTAFFFTLPRTP